MPNLVECQEFIKKIRNKKEEIKYVQLSISENNDFNHLKSFAEKKLSEYGFWISKKQSLSPDQFNKFALEHEEKVRNNYNNSRFNFEFNVFNFIHNTLIGSSLKDYQENYVFYHREIIDYSDHLEAICVENTPQKIVYKTLVLEDLKSSGIKFIKFRDTINAITSSKNLKNWKLDSEMFSIDFTENRLFKNIWNDITYREFKNLLDEENLNLSESLLLGNFIYKNRFQQIVVNNRTENEDMIIHENIDNQFQEEIIDTLKDEYGKEKVLKEIQLPNGEILYSKFNDFQVFHICKGLRDQRPLYNRFLQDKHTEEDTIKAHKLVNKLLERDGRAIINFLLSLPSLPFRSDNYITLFSKLDNLKNNGNENPVIRLIIETVNGMEKIEFSYYSENQTFYKNRIRISKRIKGRSLPVCDISRDGIVLPQENIQKEGLNKNITPILQLFYKLTQNEEGMNQAILSYGRETGECSVCGAELSNEESLRRGIGPKCESYLYR